MDFIDWPEAVPEQGAALAGLALGAAVPASGQEAASDSAAPGPLAFVTRDERTTVQAGKGFLAGVSRRRFRM